MSTTLETSTLDLFARGAWDFLVAAGALSVVIALISSALEELLRPHAQETLVLNWLKKWFLAGEDSPKWKNVAVDKLSKIGRSFYALQPDQLCAQIVRRLQTEIDFFEGRAETGEGQTPANPDGWALFGEQVEASVDELQTLLVHSAAVRAYQTSFMSALGLGVLMFGASVPFFHSAGERLNRPDLLQWTLLTLVFGVVAALLGPIIQTVIARIVRVR